MKRTAGMRERQPLHRFGDRIRLGAIGAQELQPRRRSEEEVAHLHLRAGGAARRPWLALAPALHLDRSRRAPRSACRDSIESRATAPTEASASPRNPSVAIVERSSPASLDVQCRATASGSSSRRMPPPSSVDADEALAAAGGDHVDPPRAGVERVLDELLHHARRAFDHLAGGDAVDDMLGKSADGHRRRRLKQISAQSAGSRRG